MISPTDYTERVYQKLEKKYSHQKEFLQAVREFFNTIVPALEKNPQFIKRNVLEQLVEPERIITFRVTWMDDEKNIQVNRGFRVQYNSARGPYKGGLRFHPTVNESVLKFLGFEQTFKNSLTGLPIGGGKGGSDFDPKGKSDDEIMRFCQSFMTELQKYIDPMVDIPAGDIGVGKREIGYLYGQYKRLKGAHSGVLTGKPLTLNGSLVRNEATGFGLIYYTEEMLQAHGKSFKDQTVVVSGSGNVSIYAVAKAQEYGAKVVAVSDSDGYLYDQNGIDLSILKEIKEVRQGRLSEYIKEKESTEYYEGSVWDLAVPYDIALPCATQNEIDTEKANLLIKNGVYCISEGANMPSSLEALEIYRRNGIIYGPSKAANAGGVATSTLEMSQNAQYAHWSFERVDAELQTIMIGIFHLVEDTCREYDLGDDYLTGVNIVSFLRIAEAMMSQGIV